MIFSLNKKNKKKKKKKNTNWIWQSKEIHVDVLIQRLSLAWGGKKKGWELVSFKLNSKLFSPWLTIFFYLVLEQILFPKKKKKIHSLIQ